MNFFFFSFSFLFCSFLKGVRGSFPFSLFFLFCANNANKKTFLQIISDLVIDAFEKCKKWCIFTLEKCKYCTKNTLEKCIFFEVLACFSESCCPGTIFPHIYDSLLGTDSIRRKHLSVWPDGIEITTCAVTLRRRGKLLMPFSADFKEKPKKPSCLYVGLIALCDASHIFFLVSMFVQCTDIAPARQSSSELGSALAYSQCSQIKISDSHLGLLRSPYIQSREKH